MTSQHVTGFREQRSCKLGFLRLVAIPATLLLAMITACAGEPAEVSDDTAALPQVSVDGFSHVSAILDFDAGTAVTPIGPYLTNTDFETLVLFSRARESLVTRCMTDAGQRYTGLTDVDWASLEPMADRTFGLWDRAGAARLGTSLDGSRGVPKSTTVDQGVDFNNALADCNERTAADSMLGPLSENLSKLTLADRILGNAGELAQQSAAGKSATAEFATCMQNKAIVLDPASGYMSAEYAELGTAAEITAAVGEAECNVDTGRIQKLYDLRAQYESAFIKKYESQLATVLEHKRHVHERLQSIINGST